ncbi:hypothetical protein EIL50_03060 [bacterium NHP-B]|nr:hypothetical protein EIL50_03060 [bacterium NHP-B]
MKNKMKAPLTALLAFVLSTASFHTLEARYAGFGTDSYLKAKIAKGDGPRSKSGARAGHGHPGGGHAAAAAAAPHAHGGHAAAGPFHQEDEHRIVPYGRSLRDLTHRHPAIHAPLSSTRPAPHHQGFADEDEKVFSRADYRHAANRFYNQHWELHQEAMAAQAQQHRAAMAAQEQRHRAAMAAQEQRHQQEMAAQAQQHQQEFDRFNRRLGVVAHGVNSLVSSGGHAGGGHVHGGHDAHAGGGHVHGGHDAHADGDHAHGGHGPEADHHADPAHDGHEGGW